MTISRIIWAILCHIYRQYTQSYGMSVLDTLLIGSDPVAAVLLCINGKLFSSAFIFCLGLFSKFASLSALSHNFLVSFLCIVLLQCIVQVIFVHYLVQVILFISSLNATSSYALLIIILFLFYIVEMLCCC